MSLQQQIKQNRWKSSLLFSGFIIVYLAMGWAISYWYGEIAMAVAAVIAFSMALAAIFFGDDMAIAVSGGKQIKERKEAPEVWDAVETMSIAAGIRMPRLYISPSLEPNAFAAGRSEKQALICLNSGLLTRVDKEELQAIVAHEVAHIRNQDVRLMTYAAVLAGSIALLSEMVLRMMFWGGRDRDRGGHPAMLIIAIVAIVLAPIAAVLIQMAVSRKREFLADAAAADLTKYPQGLASALERIAGQGVEREAKGPSAAMAHMYITPALRPRFGLKLFATHPPTEERIERLMQLAGQVKHNRQERAKSEVMREILAADQSWRRLPPDPQALAQEARQAQAMPQGRPPLPWESQSEAEQITSKFPLTGPPPEGYLDSDTTKRKDLPENTDALNLLDHYFGTPGGGEHFDAPPEEK
jgi:heat shock protein HtpX